MARYSIQGGGPRVPVNAGDGAVMTNRGPGTLSYATSIQGAAVGTVASGSAIDTEGSLYLYSTANCTVDVDGPAPDAVNRVRFPNTTLTFEANTLVDALQLGDDGPGTPRGQHISSADSTTTGSGAEITVNPGSAKGVDQAGAALRLASGISTGSGAPGPIVFLHSTAGASGATDRTQTDRWYMTDVSGFSVFYPATDDIAFIGLASNQINTIYTRSIVQRGAHDMVEMAAPAAPAANTGRLFVRDNGSGKTQLCVIFPTGAIQVLSTEP